MPYYSDPISVATLRHHGHHIEIFTVIVGATCCTIDHFQRQRNCTVCNAPLDHVLRYLPAIDGDLRTDLFEDSQEDATEVAKMAVDEMSGEADAKSTGSSLAIVPGEPPPAPPIEHDNGGFEPPENAPQQMVQLGWPLRAMQIVAAHPKK